MVTRNDVIRKIKNVAKKNQKTVKKLHSCKFYVLVNKKRIFSTKKRMALFIIHKKLLIKEFQFLMQSIGLPQVQVLLYSK